MVLVQRAPRPDLNRAGSTEQNQEDKPLGQSRMNFLKSKFVNERIHELGRLLLNQNSEGRDEKALSNEQVENFVRLLRPAATQYSFVNAARIKLRQRLLNHPNVGAEGPVLLSKFDTTCENLKRNFRLFNAFILFLMPVSFYEHHTTVFSNALEDERALPNMKKEFDLNTPPTVLPSTIQDEMQKNIYAHTLTRTHADMHTQAHAHGVSKSASHLDLFPPASEKIDFISSHPSYHSHTHTHYLPPALEYKLIQDILYILQGITGKHIKYDSRSESFIVDPALHIPDPVRDTVLCICELGWLYMRVSGYLKRVFGETKEGMDVSKGLVVQAFGFALQVCVNMSMGMVICHTL
ncbi:hypothetical protein EON63_17745 [archaeon]|nr:MAG: hypothetical protein EON63_17745 [archaeon]